MMLFCFFVFSLFNLLFSFRVNFGFLLMLESLKDFPLYRLDMLLLLQDYNLKLNNKDNSIIL